MDESGVLKETLECDTNCTELSCFDGYSEEAVARLFCHGNLHIIDKDTPDCIRLAFMLDAKRWLDDLNSSLMRPLQNSDLAVWSRLAQTCSVVPGEKWARARMRCAENIWNILVNSRGRIDGERLRLLEFQRGNLSARDISSSSICSIVTNDMVLRDVILVAWDWFASIPQTKILKRKRP